MARLFTYIMIPVMMFATNCSLLGLEEEDDDNSLLLLAGLVLLSNSSCSGDVLKSSTFRTLRGASQVSCTLSDGSTGTCCQLTFASNTVTDNGPFCPANATSPATNAGMGIYNGATTPGMHELSLAFLNNMEADGSDIVNGASAVRIQDPGNPAGNNNPAFIYCLQASANDNLNLTFTIPMTPKDAASVDTISSVELIGVSLDGAPINGAPPTVSGNSGNLPALDSCGGHHDPSGYYHWHFVPESINAVHAANTGGGANFGTNALSCTNITQNTSALIGFAKDGYPMYASKDTGGATPTGLESCNGHTGVTTEFPNGIYHYHASATGIPNLPTCVKGVSVTNNFTAR